MLLRSLCVARCGIALVGSGKVAHLRGYTIRGFGSQSSGSGSNDSSVPEADDGIDGLDEGWDDDGDFITKRDGKNEKKMKTLKAIEDIRKQAILKALKEKSNQQITSFEEIDPKVVQEWGRIEYVLNDNDLKESHARGSGRGGQKMQKTSNKVVLHHIPTDLVVHCHQFRDLESNRKRAKKILLDKIDQLLNGDLSHKAIKNEKIRKKKAKARAKHRKQGDDDDDDLEEVSEDSIEEDK